MRTFITATLGALIGLVAWQAPSDGATPYGIAYFGQLTHDSGAPFTGVATDVDAYLYSAPSGGDELWSDSLGDLAVLDGNFQAVLGSLGNPLDTALAHPSSLWLEFRFNDVPLLPRQEILSVPFARNAASAESLGGVPADSYALKSYVDAAPAIATAAGTAPSAPALGELWFDTSSGQLRVWQSGTWSETGSTTLSAVSAGAMTNEFSGVTGAGATVTSQILAADVTGAARTHSFSEAGGTVADSLSVAVDVDLTQPAELRFVLRAPDGTEVELSAEPFTAEPHSRQWDSATSPTLASLRGASAGGTWTVYARDNGTTIAPGSVLGDLVDSEVTLSVIRSDDVVVAGALSTTGLLTGGAGVRLGETAASCTPQLAGTLRFQSATQTVELCTGAAWTELGAGGGQTSYPASCQEIFDSGDGTTDGLYWIDPDGGPDNNAFPVHCNMTTDGGGWTKIMYFTTGRSLTAGSVNLGGMSSLGGEGKLDDNTIRLLGGGNPQMLAVLVSDPSKWVRTTWGNGWQFNDNPSSVDSYCQNYPGGGDIVFHTGASSLATYDSGNTTSNYCFNSTGGIDLQNDGVGQTNAQTIGVSQQPFVIYIRSSPAVSFLASCKAIKDSGAGTASGPYWIQPDDGNPIRAYCEQTIDGGGWTKALYFGAPRGLTSAAVSPENLDTFQGTGKWSDATINALMTGNHQMLAVHPTSPSLWLNATWGSNWQYLDNPGTDQAKCQKYTNGGHLAYHDGQTATATYTDSTTTSNYCWFGNLGGIDLQNDGVGESNAQVPSGTQVPFVMFVR